MMTIIIVIIVAASQSDDSGEVIMTKNHQTDMRKTLANK